MTLTSVFPTYRVVVTRAVLFSGLLGCNRSNDANFGTETEQPRVEGVYIAPESPLPGEPLLCATALAGGPASTAFAWSGPDGSTASGPQLPADTTVANETWTCTVSAQGAKGYSETQSVSVTVVDPDTGYVAPNTPPEAPGIAIQPATPNVGEPISCVVEQGSRDADGDQVWYRYEWTRNEAPSTVTSAAMPPEEVGRGDAFTCTVTPFDGIDEGESASDSVEVSSCDGGSLAFTGEDFVEIASTPEFDLGSGDFTIEAFVKRDASALEDPLVIVSRHDPSQGGWWLGIRQGGPNNNLVLHINDGTTTSETIGPPVEAGRWIHVAAVWQSGEATLYSDGRAADASPMPPAVDIDGPLRIGILREPASSPDELNGGWVGLLDQIHLSQTVLYTEEFTPEIQLAPDGRSVGFFEFAEGSGSSTQNDATGSANGTLYGPTWTADSPCLGG